MIRRRGRSILSLLGVWLLVSGAGAAHAQSLELHLPKVEGSVGDEVTLPLEVRHIAGKGVSAVTIRIAYDPEILSDAFSVSIDGTVAHGEGGVVAGVPATAANPPGSGYFTVVYYRNATKPISQDGTLFELTTEVVGEGATTLDYTYVLVETSGMNAEYETVAGRFTTGLLDGDADGIDEVIEGAVPNLEGGGVGDGNGDGLQDSEQAYVVSLPNASGERYVTVASDPETRLSDVTASFTPPAPPPAGAALPDGLLSFEVANLGPGEETTVTVFTTSEVDGYLKYGPTPENPTDHWYDFSFDGVTGAEILSDRIILHFVDGLRGDGDLSENGTIDDPGAPATFEGGSVTSVAEDELPDAFSLRGNYPNPFNPSTNVHFDLAENAEVGLDVYNLLGRRVLSVPSSRVQAGADRSLRVEASDLSSGTYVYRVTARSSSDTMVRSGRMTLIK